jgi:uncharacterized membrane protein
MMHRKKAVVIGAILVAVLLAGTISGITLIQTSDTASNSGTSLLARVASILGIDQQKVEDAFAQAQKEIESEALDARLKTLLEEGTITQNQADQYKSWQAMLDMPAGIELNGGRGGFGGGGYGMGEMIAPPASQPGQSTTVE